MDKKARFGFIPLSFVLIILSISLINAANIYKDKPILASEYSSSSILIWIIVAVALEFAYLFLDKFLSNIFE